MATQGDSDAAAVLDGGLTRVARQATRWIEHDWLGALCVVAFSVADPDRALNEVAARRFLRALIGRYGALGYVVGLRANGPGVPVVCYHIVGLRHALDDLRAPAPLEYALPAHHPR